MKIRKVLKNKNTQKNATVYEHENRIIVQLTGYGIIIDRSAIEKKEFNSLSEYQKFEKEFNPTSVTLVSPFKCN